MSRLYGIRMKKIEPEVAEVDQHRYKVEYTMPELGFWSDIEVDERTSRVIQIALEVGKQVRSKELRDLIGVQDAR